MTIVRLYSGDHTYDVEDAAFIVDWENGCFTIPYDHPISRELLNGCKHVRFIVASTDEAKWHVDKVQWTRDQCSVSCIPHNLLVKQSVVSDEYLLDLGMAV